MRWNSLSHGGVFVSLVPASIYGTKAVEIARIQPAEADMNVQIFRAQLTRFGFEQSIIDRLAPEPAVSELTPHHTVVKTLIWEGSTSLRIPTDVECGYNAETGEGYIHFLSSLLHFVHVRVYAKRGDLLTLPGRKIIGSVEILRSAGSTPTFSIVMHHEPKGRITHELEVYNSAFAPLKGRLGTGVKVFRLRQPYQGGIIISRML